MQTKAEVEEKFPNDTEKVINRVVWGVILAVSGDFFPRIEEKGNH